MFRYLIVRFFSSAVLFMIAFIVIKGIRIRSELSEERAMLFISALKNNGYDNPKLISKSQLNLEKNQFKCFNYIDGQYVVEYYAEATKNGKSRYIVFCATNNQLAAYDGQELPILPLWTTLDSSLLTYKNYNNKKSLDAISNYAEKIDTTRVNAVFINTQDQN